jgi:hypothetical protein
LQKAFGVGSQTPQANNVNIQKLIHDYKQKLNVAVRKEEKELILNNIQAYQMALIRQQRPDQLNPL